MRTMMALIATIMILCLRPSLAQADAIDDIVRTAMDAQKIPGLSLAVIKDGKVIRAKGYGWANIEWKLPVKPDTVFQIGSVTKQFTAAAILMLAEEGKVGLDDPLSRHVPEAPAAWHNVTVRQMLTHTSGIPSETEPEGLKIQTRQVFKPIEAIKHVKNPTLEFAPGSRWNYSNMGYYLLGLIIEKASGKPYGDFLQERIFQPLGMTHTRLNDLEAIVPHRASGYLYDDKGYGNWDPVHPALPYAAGALLSTVTDLAEWDLALSEGKLLSTASYQKMWSPTLLTNGKTHHYGFGWEMDTHSGQRRIYHSGGIPGFASVNILYPDARISVVVLCNQVTGLGGVATQIASTLLPQPANTRPVTITLRNRLNDTQVYLAGEFNGWAQIPMKRRANDWILTVKLAPGKYLYKFVADNQWFTDPGNAQTVTDERGITNSLLEVPEKP